MWWTDGYGCGFRNCVGVEVVEIGEYCSLSTFGLRIYMSGRRMVFSQTAYGSTALTAQYYIIPGHESWTGLGRTKLESIWGGNVFQVVGVGRPFSRFVRVAFACEGVGLRCGDRVVAWDGICLCL